MKRRARAALTGVRTPAILPGVPQKRASNPKNVSVREDRVRKGRSLATFPGGFQRAAPQARIRRAAPQARIRCAAPQARIRCAVPQARIRCAVPQARIRSEE